MMCSACGCMSGSLCMHVCVCVYAPMYEGRMHYDCSLRGLVFGEMKYDSSQCLTTKNAINYLGVVCCSGYSQVNYYMISIGDAVISTDFMVFDGKCH